MNLVAEPGYYVFHGVVGVENDQVHLCVGSYYADFVHLRQQVHLYKQFVCMYARLLQWFLVVFSLLEQEKRLWEVVLYVVQCCV